jgi:hypothetical protein
LGDILFVAFHLNLVFASSNSNPIVHHIAS